MIETRSYICHVTEKTVVIGRLLIGFGAVNMGAWRGAWLFRIKWLPKPAIDIDGSKH